MVTVIIVAVMAIVVAMVTVIIVAVMAIVVAMVMVVMSVPTWHLQGYHVEFLHFLRLEFQYVLSFFEMEDHDHSPSRAPRSVLNRILSRSMIVLLVMASVVVMVIVVVMAVIAILIIAVMLWNCQRMSNMLCMNLHVSSVSFLVRKHDCLEGALRHVLAKVRDEYRSVVQCDLSRGHCMGLDGSGRVAP